MADRVLLITWGDPVRGMEERAVEVFNEAIAILGRMQQEGRVERFEVSLLEPNGDLGGFMAIHGSLDQIVALRQDPEFQRNTVDATLSVDRVRHIAGYANEGVAQQIELYTSALAKVPQRA